MATDATALFEYSHRYADSVWGNLFVMPFTLRSRKMETNRSANVEQFVSKEAQVTLI